MAPRYVSEDQEPMPRGGWFDQHERPTPRRTDLAFKILAALAAVAAAAGFTAWMYAANDQPLDAKAIIVMLTIGLVPAALAYGFVRGLGMIVVGLVSMALDGPEITVNWRDLGHDLRLRVTWATLLEAALFIAAAVMMVYSLNDAVRHGSAYSAAVCALLGAMTWWPFIRHRIRFGRWPG